VAEKPQVSVPWPASSPRNYCPQQDPDETAGHDRAVAVSMSLAPSATNTRTPCTSNSPCPPAACCATSPAAAVCPYRQASSRPAPWSACHACTTRTRITRLHVARERWTILVDPICLSSPATNANAGTEDTAGGIDLVYQNCRPRASSRARSRDPRHRFLAWPTDKDRAPSSRAATIVQENVVLVIIELASCISRLYSILPYIGNQGVAGARNRAQYETNTIDLVLFPAREPKLDPTERHRRARSARCTIDRVRGLVSCRFY
jgi:hypothetical protein